MNMTVGMHNLCSFTLSLIVLSRAAVCSVLSVDVCNSVAHLHCHHQPSGGGKEGGRGCWRLLEIHSFSLAMTETLPSLHFPEPASLVHFLLMQSCV